MSDEYLLGVTLAKALVGLSRIRFLCVRHNRPKSSQPSQLQCIDANIRSFFYIQALEYFLTLLHPNYGYVQLEIK